jgi:AraC family transcriptional regulator
MSSAFATSSPRTLEDYAARVERVHAYLAEHLDGDIDLDRLADVACFSPFHFHRIYHALLGETVAESVRRLRLHRAALDLLAHRLPIAQIAARAGYGSQAAFTRAFGVAYGTPPAAYRAGSAAGYAAAAVDIRTCAAVDVMARRHVGDYATIGTTFELLNATAIGRGWVTEPSRYFGLYYCDPAATPAAALRSDACVSAPPGPTADDDDLRRVTIEGGRYAVLLHVGPYAELHRAYTWLYREWLPASGEDPADRPCVEEYLNNPRQVPASELRTEIWLPLSG